MSVVEIVIYSYAPGSVVINYIAEVVANNLTTDEVMEELRIIASVVNNNTINETVYGDKLNVLKQFEFGEVSVHDAGKCIFEELDFKFRMFLQYMGDAMIVSDNLIPAVLFCLESIMVQVFNTKN